MTQHTRKTAKEDNSLDTSNAMFNLFAKSDSFWWPYRSLAKALLGTQKNASAYLEANRKLIDEMRAIVRKEHDLALEISQKALTGVAESNWPSNGGSAPDTSEMNAIFDRAMSGMQELGEAWMGAQVRSLDAMRSHATTGRRPAATHDHSASAAA